ncbi:MAG TPA: hypothetical protein VKT49_21770 [Bryobacteraceae bacterium]|nr:hypothetical protein [Bryobacteraceae bacterium]
MTTVREIRLFDPHRDPRDWTDVIAPAQCAVFLKDRETSTSLDANGKPYSDPLETTCFLFDFIDAAVKFCEQKVLALPRLRCEIYDSEGLARPPLLVVVHPDFQHAEDSSSFWSRRRKLIAVALFLASPPLIWLDMRHTNELVLPTFLAFTCILTGLRFLYWDFGVKNREQERQRRLAAHRRKERGDA